MDLGRFWKILGLELDVREDYSGYSKGFFGQGEVESMARGWGG